MERSFPRRIDSLERIFAFAAEFFASERIDPRHHYAVDFALEEVFTNLVKYARDAAPEVRVVLDRTGSKLRVAVTAFETEPFDPTAAPDPPVDLPLEQRKPGGLGIFLTRKLMDTMDYRYEDRSSTITLTKHLE